MLIADWSETFFTTGDTKDFRLSMEVRSWAKIKKNETIRIRIKVNRDIVLSMVESARLRGREAGEARKTIKQFERMTANLR